jgi:hypothetical protein
VSKGTTLCSFLEPLNARLTDTPRKVGYGTFLLPSGWFPRDFCVSSDYYDGE